MFYMVKLLDRIKSKIFPILLASNIAIAGACGPNVNFDEKWTIDNIPDDSQIAQIMDNIQKKGKECHDDRWTELSRCDKKNYISDTASLALYVLNKKGIDETPLCIGYGIEGDENNMFRGYYIPSDDCIWINRQYHITVPNNLLRIIFHEMGHKKHYELNGGKNENVSNFFEHYFPAFSNTLFVPSDYPVFNNIIYDSTEYPVSQYIFHKRFHRTLDFFDDIETYEDSYKKYFKEEADAVYLQYKIFGQNKGDFDKTLDILVDYGASEDFVDDTNNGTACDNIKAGVDTYENFILSATDGGYKAVSPKDNKEYNISDQFYKIDLCGAKLNMDTWRIETE